MRGLRSFLLLLLCLAFAVRAQCPLDSVLADSIAYKPTDGTYKGRFYLAADGTTLRQTAEYSSSCTATIVSDITVITDDAFNATVTACTPSGQCPATVCPRVDTRESFTFVFNSDCNSGTIRSDAGLTLTWASAAVRSSISTSLVLAAVLSAVALGAL